MQFMFHSLETEERRTQLRRRVNSSAWLVIREIRVREWRMTIGWKSGAKCWAEGNFQSQADQRGWHDTFELNFMVDSGWNYRTVYARFCSANTNCVSRPYYWNYSFSSSSVVGSYLLLPVSFVTRALFHTHTET